jgi:DNA-binding NarL/FixJ family response regulator
VIASNLAMRLGLREVLSNLPDILVISATPYLDDLPDENVDVHVMVAPASLEARGFPRAVLFLTENPNDVQVLLNHNIPAWGALPVNASEDELHIAIQALANGLWIGAPNLVQKWFTKKPDLGLEESESTRLALTERETEVLQMAAQGLSNKQIAYHLSLSEHTIKFHLSALYAKLDVTNRTEAVRVGVRAGLVVL